MPSRVTAYGISYFRELGDSQRPLCGLGMTDAEIPIYPSVMPSRVTAYGISYFRELGDSQRPLCGLGMTDAEIPIYPSVMPSRVTAYGISLRCYSHFFSLDLLLMEMCLPCLPWVR